MSRTPYCHAAAGGVEGTCRSGVTRRLAGGNQSVLAMGRWWQCVLMFKLKDMEMDLGETTLTRKMEKHVSREIVNQL